MKKIIITALVAGMAIASQADIFISYRTGFGVSDGGDISGNTPLLGVGERAMVQLIYAGANGIVDGVAGIGGGVSGDDIVISEIFSPVVQPADVGGFFREFGIWDQYNVTFNGALDGNVYGRVFQSDVAAPGSFYYQSGLFAASDKDPVGPPADTPEVFNLGDNAIALADQQVIPEPATFGLMGIAGLGMFLARKKTRR